MEHALLKIEVYRPLEFAKFVGVSPVTIVTWINSGKLKGHKIGGRYYIPAMELERLKTQ